MLVVKLMLESDAFGLNSGTLTQSWEAEVMLALRFYRKLAHLEALEPCRAGGGSFKAEVFYPR